MFVPLVSTPNATASRAVGTKRRKIGGWGRRALKCTLSRSSAWELTGDVSKENEGFRGLRRSWVVPLASAKEVLGSSTRSNDEVRTISAMTHFGTTGVRTRGCAATARRVARDPVARKAAQINVRSKFYAKKSKRRNFRSWRSQKGLQRWAVANPSIPFVKKRCFCRRPGQRQATGRRLHTSLSCAYDILSSTLQFHRPSTGPSRRSMTPLQEVWARPRKHLR